MSGKIFSVGKAVTYQLDEGDKECKQGSGVVTQVVADVVAIKPNAGCAGVKEIHRINVDGNLMLKKS